MDKIKKITIVAVLVASSAMFSFANGQDISEERREALKQHQEEEAGRFRPIKGITLPSGSK